MMYSFYVDWITKIIGESSAAESGKFPLNIIANSREEGLTQALNIAQGMARAFNNTNIRFYYRVL